MTTVKGKARPIRTADALWPDTLSDAEFEALAARLPDFDIRPWVRAVLEIVNRKIEANEPHDGANDAGNSRGGTMPKK